MVGRVVIGTLGTLNTMLSPLAPESTDNPAGKYPLDLRQAEHVVESCMDTANQKVNSHLALSIEKASSRYFDARLEGIICLTEQKIKVIDIRLKLPLELLDEEKVEKIPVGFGYVVHGLPSESGTGSTRVKMTKMKSENGSTPIRIEWLANDSENSPEHEPMTIWLTHATEQTPIWKKIQIDGLNRYLRNPIEVKGELAVDKR